jgi:hypothetical protein
LGVWGMMVAEKELGQYSLFPQANIEDINKAKALLADYKRMKMVIDDLENNHLTATIAYKKYVQHIQDIDRAVNLILDERIKRIVINRYIKGVSRSKTIELFSDRCDRTIDRNLYEGIESIANTFKVWKEE